MITSFLPKTLRQICTVVCPALAFLITVTTPIGTVIRYSFLQFTDLVGMQVTQENYMFLFIFSLTGLVAGIYSAHNDSRLDPFAAMGYTGSALGVTLAGDWITMILFWEFMAVTSLMLIWDNRTTRSTKAGFRYLVMHMFGGNCLLFGIVWKVFHGSILIGNINQAPDPGFWFILIGVLVNAGAFPFHAWVPDAYPEATLSGTIYLGSFTTKVAVLCLLRIFAGNKILLIAGIVMIFYGALFAMMENDMRRLLSYHIISQVGYMVADAGLGGEIGINAGTALAYSNIIYKSLLFMCAGAIIHATGIRKINQLGGLAKKMPFVCICFFIAALSITGVPPLAGFTCKSLSILAAEELGGELVVLLMMTGSIATALSIPFKMGYFIFFGKDRNLSVGKIPANMKIAMAISAGMCIFTGMFPQLTYRLLPYALDYRPYTLHHILEYVQLVGAALIAFLLFLKIMEPYSMLTLDTDWFVRKPMKRILFGLSKAVCALQSFCAGGGRKLYHTLQITSANPYRVLRQKPYNKADQKDRLHYQEDAYRVKIGAGMASVLIAILLVAAYIILKH